MSWINKQLGAFFVSLLIAFVALEFFSYLLVRGNLLLVNETPRLYQSIFNFSGNVGTNWWTERDLWGAWHQKNSVAQHSRNCFSAEYRSNSFGARDTEFADSQSENNYVLLGDSFAEGFGVNEEETAQRLIEINTGLEVLNFGTAGDFGPLQYWLVYQNLARRFAHDGLIIFFFPSNDFVDNDYNYWIRTRSTFLNDNGDERYRPYYKRNAQGEYEYFIPPNAVKREIWAYPGVQTESVQTSFKQFVVDNLWLANVLRTIKIILIGKSLEKANTSANDQVQSYSGYFDASVEQQEAAIYFIKKIVTTTSAKRVLIVSIPKPEDFFRVSQGASRENLYWWSQFRALEESSTKSIQFVDLVDHKPKDIDSLFFTCDGHWSAVGNSWAAKIVSDKLVK